MSPSDATDASGQIFTYAAAPPTSVPLQQNQQYQMCYTPVQQLVDDCGNKLEAESQHFGMCIVTERPEGLSVDIPSSISRMAGSQTSGKYVTMGTQQIEGFCIAKPMMTTVAEPTHSSTIYIPATTATTTTSPPCIDPTSPISNARMPSQMPHPTFASSSSLPSAEYACSMNPKPTPIYYPGGVVPAQPPIAYAFQPMNFIPMQYQLPPPILLPTNHSMLPCFQPHPQPHIIRLEFPCLLTDLRSESPLSPYSMPIPAATTNTNIVPNLCPIHEQCMCAINPTQKGEFVNEGTPTHSTATSPGAAPTAEPSMASKLKITEQKICPGRGNICKKCGSSWHCPRCSSCCWYPGPSRPCISDQQKCC